MLCGASGAGKSSVGFEIFDRLRSQGVVTARVDFDEIGACHPARVEDPENHLLKARNLAVMWRNFEAVGARCIVASGGIERGENVAIYRGAIPGAVFTLCRLRVGRQEQRARIMHRGRLLGVGGNAAVSSYTTARLEALADEAAREADEIDRSEIGDFCVDTDGLEVPTVARLVLARAGGWPHLSAPKRLVAGSATHDAGNVETGNTA